MYEAFISYRHVSKDTKWAIWLHRSLERYRTPKPLQATGIRARTDRVFRDIDELPASGDLNESIREALKRSRSLIVICSQSTPLSRWVNAEVEYFAGLGRARSILVLLIDGEPPDVFPASLKTLGLEPLAADVRPGTRVSRKRKRIALLKILAAVFGCGYDDLFQREQQRLARRRRQLVAATAVVLAAIAILAGYTIRSRIRELSTYSDQILSTDPSLSVLLSRVAFENSRLWFNIGRQFARPALERALMASPLRDEFDPRDTWIRGLAWSPGGLIVSGGYYGHLTAWDRRGRKLASSEQARQGVERVVFGPSSDPQVAITGNYRIVSIWDLKVSKIWPLRDFYQGLNLQASDVSWCSMAHRLAASYGANVAVVFEPNKPGADRELSQPDWVYVNSVAWNPTCDKLAIGTASGLFVWESGTDTFLHIDLEKPLTVNVTQVRSEGVRRVAWNRNGNTLAASAEDGTVRVLNLNQPGDRDLLSAHQGEVNDVAWSPDGDRLASAGSDSTVIVWQRSASSDTYLPHVIHAGQKDVLSLAWSPDGTEIASGDIEGPIKIWRVSDIAEEVDLAGHRGTLLVNNDDDQLSIDNRTLTDAELVELARQRTFRPFSKEECAKYFPIEPCHP